jgi:hypothetical protein
MRIGQLIAVVGFVVALQALGTAALADRDGRGGPLPLLGVSALGQAGAAAGGAFLVWRRRRAARKSTKQ